MTDAKYVKRTIIHEQIQSAYLIEKRNVRVYLPPGFNSLSTYPVLYCQDGEEFFNFGRIATITNRLILDHGLNSLIIVGVDVDKKVRFSEYSPDGERFNDYKQFFALELLPYIEKKYPVKTDVENRVIAGDSLGATISLHITLDYPYLFHKIISLSGAFYPRTQQRIMVERDLSWLKLYMLIGLDEEMVVTPHGKYNFLSLNRETFGLLQEKDAEIYYLEREGKHTWGFWQKELPEAIQYFFKSR